MKESSPETEERRPRRSSDRIRSLRRRWRSARVELLRFLLRVAPSEQRRLIVLTVLVGLVCGLAAVAFHIALRDMASFLSLKIQKDSNWIAWLILSPTIGGLVAGVLLHSWVPEARGSGVPEIKRAYIESDVRMPFRVIVGKFIVSVIQIGSGASLGREGPTAQICAGISVLLGNLGALSRRALRRMMPVGVAAGIAAAFNAPISAVTFAIEEIVGDLDKAVLSGVVIAAATAAAVERGVLGEHPLLASPTEYRFQSGSSLILYLVLGILAGVVSIGFTRSLLYLRARFRELTIVPAWARPAAGGLITGVLAVIAILWVGSEGITGGGYTTLTRGLAGEVALKAALVLTLFKLVATVFSYASGGSGGIFAPSLFIGGMLGCSVGYLDQILFGTQGQVGEFALVGMGAVFAAVIRAPITSVLIIFEMTDGYALIPPLMIANMTAYLLARHWHSLPIYDSLLEQDGFPMRDRETTGLSRIPVGTVMTTKAVLVEDSSTVSEALDQLIDYEYAIYPVVGAGARFVGFINRYRLLRALQDGKGDHLVSEFMSESEVLHPDTPLNVAVDRLHREGIHLLPVVERAESHVFLGLLTSTDVVRAEAEAAEDSTT